jgi:hypothetical protein
MGATISVMIATIGNTKENSKVANFLLAQCELQFVYGDHKPANPTPWKWRLEMFM